MMDIDWQVNKSIPECNKYMLENEIATDVVFIVSQVDRIGRSSTKPESSMTSDEPSACKKRRVSKDQATPSPVRIKAHKYMLVSRSPVFYAMFLGPLAEQGEVTVTDCHPEAFRQMLNYIYFDKVNLTDETIMPIWYTANKYFIPEVVKLCEEYFYKLLKPTNALELLDYALDWQLPDMTKACTDVIKWHTTTALHQDYHPSSRAMAEVLHLDVINKTEMQLFEFLFQWGETEAEKCGLDITAVNIRKVINDCVFAIRYPLFTVSIMVHIVGKRNILTPTELWYIVQYMCSAEKEEIPYNLSCENRFTAEHCFTVNVPEKSTVKKQNCKSTSMEIQMISTKAIMISQLTLGVVDKLDSPDVRYESQLASFDDHNIIDMILINSTGLNGSTAFGEGQHVSILFKHGLHLKAGHCHKLQVALSILPNGSDPVPNIKLLFIRGCKDIEVNPGKDGDFRMTMISFDINHRKMKCVFPVASISYFNHPNTE